MRKLVDSCNSSNPCPAVWETDDDTEYLIQGYIVEPETLAKVNPPEGESVVRIPRSILIELAEKMIARGEVGAEVSV